MALFQHVAAALKVDSLNLKGSCKYRPLDDYLIDRERLEKERRALLDRVGLADTIQAVARPSFADFTAPEPLA